MSGALPDLFENNRRWARDMLRQDPHFFSRLLAQQAPEYLWIGCADSRVPANEIVGLHPGELFVHRNVANVVLHTDLNCLSVLQYAIDVLRVRHVIVCGHYGCGGVQAALRGSRLGLIDNWLRNVQDIRDKYSAPLAEAGREPAQLDMLCELNVLEQALHVCETTVVRDAWDRRQPLFVHAWIYRLEDGLLRDLGLAVSNPADLGSAVRTAVDALSSGNRNTRKEV